MPPKREEVTQLEKNIYNAYLRISRTRQNKPYKLRKNFNGFVDYEYYFCVKRLEIFFKKYPHINISNFFNSPYELYPDDNIVYDLKYYISSKAIKIYSLYMKQQDQLDPDTEYQIQFVKDSLLVIFKFCRDNKLQLHEYIKHKTGDIPTFVLHLKDRRVSIYTLLNMGGFEAELIKVPNDRLNFTVGENFTSLLEQYRNRHYTCRSNKVIAVKGIKQIKKLLTVNS